MQCDPIRNPILLVPFQVQIFQIRRIGQIRILSIGLELACNGGSCGGILKIDYCHLHLKRLPRISLTSKLVPVHCREYEYGLLTIQL